MIKGKPQLVFGADNVLSKGIDAGSGAKAKSSISLKKEHEVASKFASYLQSESTATSKPTPSPLASMQKNSTTQSLKGGESVFSKPESNIATSVNSHFGRNFSIGAEETKQGTSPRDFFTRNTRLEKPQGRHIPTGTRVPAGKRVPAEMLSKGFNSNQETMEKALASSTTPVRASKSTPQFVTSEHAAKTSGMRKTSTSASPSHATNVANPSGVGLNTFGSSTSLAFQNKKHKNTGSMTFDYTFSSGQETKNLLQAFKKAEVTLKNNGIQVAEAPYKVPFVKKTTLPLHAKGIAANGYTGKYANTEAKVAGNGFQSSSRANISVGGDPSNLGSLSAKFESGEMGGSAVGYDRHGGTSYGKFQISSRAGTMKNFIGYLKKTAPDIAERLSKAGPSNTGSRNGRMPTEWRAIAKEQPERFEALQNNFIMKSHFEPAMTALTDVGGVNFEGLSPALKEVVFSTAVQHGVSGAAKIIDRAVQQVGVNKLHGSLSGGKGIEAEQALIRNIYTIRSRQFGSSSNKVKVAVKNRLRHEMQDALALLKEENMQNTVSSSFESSQNRMRSLSLKAASAQNTGLHNNANRGIRQVG